MKNKYVFVAVMLSVLILVGAGLTNLYVRFEQNVLKKDQDKQDNFSVLTSFYPMYIAAKNIIGECDGVTLQNLSEPQTGCLHDYQLTTEDMVKLSSADVFIVNGGGIENFLTDVAAQYPDLKIINACERMELLDDNAHAWMSIPDYMAQVRTIAEGLSAEDPVHRAVYEEHCLDYLDKLDTLLQQQQKLSKPAAGQNIVIFHEAFDYIAKDYGFTVSASMDLDEERQISAGEVASLLDQIRRFDVRLILAEEQYGRELCETIQKEAEVRVVYLDPCVRGDYNAESYLNAMGENIIQLKQALLETDNS